MAPITITVDDGDEFAAAIAARVVLLLEAGAVRTDRPDPGDGYLAPAAAARYLGVPRKRVYSLNSIGVLVPDGHDGRTPLFTRTTLDAYVRGTRLVDHVENVDRRNGRNGRPNPSTTRRTRDRRPLASSKLTQ